MFRERLNDARRRCERLNDGAVAVGAQCVRLFSYWLVYLARFAVT